MSHKKKPKKHEQMRALSKPQPQTDNQKLNTVGSTPKSNQPSKGERLAGLLKDGPSYVANGVGYVFNGILQGVVGLAFKNKWDYEMVDNSSPSLQIAPTNETISLSPIDKEASETPLQSPKTETQAPVSTNEQLVVTEVEEVMPTTEPQEIVNSIEPLPLPISVAQPSQEHPPQLPTLEAPKEENSLFGGELVINSPVSPDYVSSSSSDEAEEEKIQETVTENRELFYQQLDKINNGYKAMFAQYKTYREQRENSHIDDKVFALKCFVQRINTILKNANANKSNIDPAQLFKDLETESVAAINNAVLSTHRSKSKRALVHIINGFIDIIRKAHHLFTKNPTAPSEEKIKKQPTTVFGRFFDRRTLAVQIVDGFRTSIPRDELEPTTNNETEEDNVAESLASAKR